MGLRSKSTTQPSTPNPPVESGRPKKSREEKLAYRGLAAHDSERERYVEDLKRAVWSGNYDPSDEEIAAAIISEREKDRLGDV